MTARAPFQIGQVVTLNSGSPLLTVTGFEGVKIESVGSEPEFLTIDSVKVSWIDNAVPFDGSYPAACLRAADRLRVVGESDQ